MHRKTIQYSILFTASAILYISFMSIGLDDFDSFAFAFALDRWDTALIQVHPPGFPIYIFIAKLIQLLVQDTQVALTLMSAICGATAIVLLAMLPPRPQHKQAGMIAGLLLIFMPGYWLYSEIALSDIPGITFMLMAVVFLLRTHREHITRNFVLGCFFTGLSLGVRPHNAMPIILAGIIALYHLLPLNSHYMQKLVYGVVAGSIGVAFWLIPTYQTFDGYRGYSGLEGYLDRLNNHQQHIQSSDSIFQQELNTNTITRRVNNYVDGWSHLIAGKDIKMLILIAGLMLIGIVKLPLRDRFTWFVVIWFAIEALKIFLLASLERPRLFLPALVPLILLVGLGYSQWRGTFQFVRIGIIGLILLSLSSGIPIIQKLNQIPPPPEQATTHILHNYQLTNGSALVVSQGSFQAAQYHLESYKQLYTPYFEVETWSTQIATDQPDYLIILDGDDIAPEIFEALTIEPDYITIEDITFERDPRVFPQHSTVRLQIMTQRQNLQPEQLQLPESGIIYTSHSDHSKYFSRGWYRSEDVGGTPARWANQVVDLQVSLPAVDTMMMFVASPYIGGQVVEVIINDIIIGTIDINEIWGTYQILIPANSIGNHDISRIELHHAMAEYPENHNRQLATAYREFRFEMLPN